MPNDILDCTVQMCGFPTLDVVPMDQSIPREMWVKWDCLKTTQVQPEQSVSTVVNYDSDSTITYDLEEVMNMGYESNSNHSNNIPSSNDEVIRAITPVAWLDNPLPRPQHVVTDNYSPASPVYSPDHSPIQIDSDEEEVESRASMAPAPLDIPIVTPANDIFESDNSDSDLDFKGETDGKNILNDYLTTGKLPIRMHGVDIYPQSYHVHNHTWSEYSDEPCSPHCMIPNRTDKSFAKFYLTNSLCQKHNSSLTGPWIYLSNRFSTLPKLHKCPEICHFITLLNQKIKANHQIRDSLIACQLVENQHVFTLIIRLDVFLINDPFTLKSWHQSYNLDDMPSFTAKLHYYLQRDFVDKVHDAYLNGQP